VSDRKHAEVEEIVSVSQSVRGAAGLMAEAAGYAEAADPDVSMWGVVGMPFAFAYNLATPQIHLMLHALPGAIEGVAQRIEDAAKAIADYDDEVKRSFDDLNSAVEA
jgi:hypothetical protein